MAKTAKQASSEEAAQAAALVIKAQHLAGHFPESQDVKLGLQVYLGELDADQVIDGIIEQERE